MNRMTRTNTASFPRGRGIAVALVAACLFVFPAAAYAQAKPPVDNGVRCAGKHPSGEWEFFLPGEKATDSEGRRWICGADGRWVRDYTVIRASQPAVQLVLASAALAG
jgi:hypothetical protein